MKKAVMVWLMLFLLVNSLFAIAQTASTSSGSSTSSDCNWWCKVKAAFSGGVVGNRV